MDIEFTRKKNYGPTGRIPIMLRSSNCILTQAFTPSFSMVVWYLIINLFNSLLNWCIGFIILYILWIGRTINGTLRLLDATDTVMHLCSSTNTFWLVWFTTAVMAIVSVGKIIRGKNVIVDAVDNSNFLSLFRLCGNRWAHAKARR